MSEFDKHITIDAHDLDNEWLNQAATFHHYLVQHANAQRDREVLRDDLDRVVAQLSAEARQVWVGSKPPTETSVKQSLLENSDYQSRVEDLREADHNCNILQAAVKAMDVKKTALENLVKLKGMDWHSQPSTSRDDQLERSMADHGVAPKPDRPKRKLGKVGDK